MAIVNITCTCCLNTSLDLKAISGQLKDAVKYDPSKFNGLILKISRPKATALLFSRGKIVVTGTKSVRENKLACQKVNQVLKSIGITTRLGKIAIQNMVWSDSISAPVSVEAFCREDKNASFEAELFPGGIYRFQNSNCKATFFYNGKYFLTGMRDEADCLEKALEFSEKLTRYRLI